MSQNLKMAREATAVKTGRKQKRGKGGGGGVVSHYYSCFLRSCKRYHTLRVSLLKSLSFPLSLSLGWFRPLVIENAD